MRLFPFTFVKKSRLNQLAEEYASLQSQIVSAAEFISEIEKGNLEAKYHQEEQLSEKGTDDQLGSSLISLRTQMVKVSLEERQRSWVAETRSKFMDILRSRNNDLKELADDIISNLIKYLSANQGGLYVVNDDDPNDVHVELLACYAYERKKYITQRIEIGHGLVGQIILEKESMYMTEIPENYLKITSGLGQANPRHLLIVPLKLEEKVFGAIEIASFHPIKAHEIEFTEQLGESIASTIATVKNNHQTRRLLEESQQQAEEMRAQEEEVRQNMEELSATQEEMQRVMKEVQSNEAFMTGLIDSTNDSIITIDKGYKIISCNKATRETYKASGLEIVKGFDIFDLFVDEQKPKYKAFYDRALRGEIFEVTESYKYGEREQYFTVTYSPLRNEKGEIIGAACFGKDITEIEQARMNNEKLLEESQMNAEIMKAQEEEMTRMLQESQQKERYITELMDASKDSIFVIDKTYCLINFNGTFKNALTQMGVQIREGSDVFQILAEEERAHHKELYDRVFKGEAFEVTEHISVADAYYLSTYTPMRDEQGEVYGCAVFAKDITELIKTQKQAEALLHESQQQSEELRAQEEELRQNMEELSATQEEMQRIMTEIQANEHYLNELLNLTQDTVYTLNEEAKIMTFNTFFAENMKKYGFKVEKGFDYMAILPSEEEKKNQKQIIDKVFAGETIQIPLSYDVEEGEIHLISTYSPVKNAEGKIIAAAIYSKDVTELVMIKRQQDGQTWK